MNKNILIFIFFILLLVDLSAQDPRNLANPNTNGANSEPNVNGMPYSKWKALQEESKQKEEEQRSKSNINSSFSNTPVVISGNYTGHNVGNQFLSTDYKSIPNGISSDSFLSSFINAFGYQSVSKNRGFYVNAIGVYSAYENTGFEVNAIGTYAGYCNTHNYVNIVGVYNADAPQDEATILTGDLFLRDPYESGGNISGNSIYFNSSKTARVWYDKSAGEIKVTDNSGNSTTISPHNFSLLKPSEELAWSFYSMNEEKGKQVNVDMMKVVRLLEQLTGEKLIYIADLDGNELNQQIEKVTSLSDRISKLETENAELRELLKVLILDLKEHKK